jgi:hypothetical protein
MPQIPLLAVLSLLAPICFASVWLAPGNAFAHSVVNGPHGGEVEDATPGPIHIETVVKGTTVTVYLADENDKALPVTGATGTVIVLANQKKFSIPLAPTDAGMLTGTGSFASDPNMKALVTLTVSGVKQQALFSMLSGQVQ